MAVRIAPREDQRAENKRIEQQILEDPAGYFDRERERVREEVERELASARGNQD